MDIQKITDVAEMLIIKNVFSEKELSEMWDEIRYYYNRQFFYPPELTSPALYEDGTPMKKNIAVFIDTIYNDDSRSISAVMEYTEKKLLSTEIKNCMQDINPVHGIFKNANRHFTLLNYYENSDHYDFHIDADAYSTLTYIYQEPKRFSGGEIVFRVRDNEIKIEIENNMSIVFPSCYEHKVLPVVMEKSDEGKMLGRFSIAQFVSIGV